MITLICYLATITGALLLATLLADVVADTPVEGALTTLLPEDNEC